MSVGHLCIDWRRESAIDIVTAYLAVSMRLRREKVGQCVTPGVEGNLGTCGRVAGQRVAGAHDLVRTTRRCETVGLCNS